MPLFMMISGYFASSAMQLNTSEFIKKKFIQLILPCITWGIALSIVFLIVKGVDSATNCLSGIIYNFWFLKSVFICYMIVYFGKKVFKNGYLFIVFSILFVHQWQLYNTPIMYPCFLVGMWIKHKSICWQKHVMLLGSISLLVFVFLLCFWNKSFWNYQAFHIYNCIIDHGSFSFMNLYKEVYRIAIGISGSLTFIFLFYILFRHQKETKLWALCCDWGKYTLGIYILQSYILEAIMARYINLDSLGFVTFNFIVAPFLSIIVLIVCVYIIKLLQREKFISLIFFGK